MNISLRTTLGGLWMLIVVVCVALATMMAGVYHLGVSGETRHVREQVERSGESIAARYAVYSGGIPVGQVIDREEKSRALNVVSDLVLNDFKAVEGGFWEERAGFVAYSFPTYEGAAAKKDVPAAEAERIASLCREALEANTHLEKRYDGIRESLIIGVRPVGREGLVVWTMARAHVASAAAFQKLTAGFAVLLAFGLVSGGVVLWLLRRWSSRVTQLEETIARATPDHLPLLPATGEKELDRIVMALNQLSGRLREAQSRSERLGQDLARSERTAALGRLAAEVAHEIRNPIAAIRLRAENALAKTDRHRAGALEFVIGEVMRLEDLISRLLAIAHLEQVDRRSIVLRTWLAARLEHFREQAARQEIALLPECTEGACTFDEKKISRALDNLLINALQHTPKGGKVVVRAELGAGDCLFAVENSGTPIPAEKRISIFEPFASERDGGTGLGLSIALEIAKAHGGTLRCVDIDHGARFEMKIPCPES